MSDVDPTLVLAFFASLAGVAFTVAAAVSARTRDLLPIAACVGALVCSLNEPIYDLLGKIVYAADHHVAYTNLGRDIPWFLVLGYIPWVGLLPYAISRLMASGTSRTALHAIALGSFSSVVLIEVAGTSLDAWAYYGDPPLQYIGVAPQMSAMPIVGGFLLYAIGTRVPSLAGRALVGLLVPTVSLPLVYASVSWPLYTGIYADVPKAVEWLAALLTLALAASAVAVTTMLAARIREGDRAAKPLVAGLAPASAGT